MLSLFKRLWLGWNRGIRGLMRLQSKVIMTVAYFVGIGPVAIVFRVLGKTLLDRGPAVPGARTFWLARTDGEATMKDASRPF